MFNSLRLQRLKLFTKIDSLANSNSVHSSHVNSDCCSLDIQENDIIYLDECLITGSESVTDQENVALYYIAGYVQHKVDPLRQMEVTVSKSVSSEFTDNISRGNC